MTASLSEAAAKLREEAFEAFLQSLERDDSVETALDNYREALGITWEQAAKLKSGEAHIMMWNIEDQDSLP